MEVVNKRKSILHALNVFLLNPIQIYPSRETSKYIIGYQPKIFRQHSLIIKISKELLNTIQNTVYANKAIDINIREDYRLTIKSTDSDTRLHTDNRMKNITIRIMPTRYPELTPIYAITFDFRWRKTNAGGRDYMEFNIPECPLIANYNTIPDICYKLINKQISGTGSHALYTYLILSKSRGQIEIGKHIKISNMSKHEYVYPISVTL